MKDERMGDVIQHLRQIVRPGLSVGLSDSELLQRWVSHRDEAAFEVLLWRHGPMVLGVCRRILHDAHEAEDAFQATFLALTRKAGSIGRREAVAGWLYRVAFRAALQARASAAKRPALDADSLASVAVEPIEDFLWRDLRPVLDEEVNRLPAKYREPFVLRYLEGRTNEEVARELGCPVGTALSRLARARERLRSRLTRRGLALSAGALAAGLGSNALAATVSPRIILTLVQAAMVVAAGRTPAVSLVSANAVVLAEGVLRAVTLTKLKVLFVMLTLGLLGAGGALLAHQLNAGQPTVSGLPAEQQSSAKETGERPGQRSDPNAPPKTDEPPRAEERAADADAALKRKQAEERAVQQDKAIKRLRVAQQEYQDLEKQFAEALKPWREELLRAEEQLRLLEREQAAERNREREQIKAVEAALLKIGRGDNKAEQEQLKQLDEVSKKREAERTERLIETRLKVVRVEERLRMLEREQGLQRELAQARQRSAAERVLQLEEDRPPTDPQVRALGNLERKVESLLREIGELRRALDKQQPSKGRPSER